MPKNEKLRVEIIWLHHDILVAGYREKSELVARNYWWLGVTKNIRKYVDRYNMCQKMKNRIEVPTEKMIANKVLKRPWMVDFITKLLLVVEKDAILVVHNRLSKIVYFVTITKRMSAERLVQLFRDKIWKLHRLLESMILNRRLWFVAELTKKLNKILGIETKVVNIISSTNR